MKPLPSVVRPAALCAPILLATLFCAVTARASVMMPDTGEAAIRQRALALGTTDRVMMVALRPGEEDFATIARLRLGSGARIMELFVTNGEAGESDGEAMLPQELAATLRLASTAAAESLDTEPLFLNLPDLVACSDSLRLADSWPGDSLLHRLVLTIGQMKPHLVILCRDRSSGAPGLAWQSLRSRLKDAITLLDPRKKNALRVIVPGADPWAVGRFIADDGSPGNADPGSGSGGSIPGMKSYDEIARSLEELFAVQRIQRAGRTASSYSLVLPRTTRGAALREPAARVPGKLLSLGRSLQTLALNALSRKRNQGKLLAATAAAMDSLDIGIGKFYREKGEELPVLLQWKICLENLRNALLGVSVRYNLSESVLTARQLVYLRIDAITGLTSDGSTVVYLPAADRGWVLNESLKQRLPLAPPQEIRLLTPKDVDCDLPAAGAALTHNVTVHPTMVFVIHEAKDRTRSFVYRISLPIRFAPRFAVDVLTPIVRSTDGERVRVRLTNNSRDGVRDVIKVEDSLVVSTPGAFRLNGKGASVEDTLFLRWKAPSTDDMHLLSLKIQTDVVGQCAARRFSVEADTSRRVLLISGTGGSPTAETLRRLGYAHVVLDGSGNPSADQLAAADVVVLDFRVLTLLPQLRQHLASVVAGVTGRGGHVVILAQEANSWDEHSFGGVRLTATSKLDDSTNVLLDSLSWFCTGPNHITRSDFSGWVFRKGFNDLALAPGVHAEIPVRVAQTGAPLVVRIPTGTGAITYVDLALAPQWMSVHPGTLKIFAELLSHRQ